MAAAALTACSANHSSVPHVGSAFVSVPLPKGVNGPNAIARGPNQTEWFVTSNGTSRPSTVGFVSETDAVTVYYGGRHRGLHDDGIGFFGIAEGPDGNLWFSEPLNGKIARITPGGIVTETLAGGKLPFKITPGPRRAMWYTLSGSSAIGEIAAAPHLVAKAFPIPSPRPGATSNPQAIVAGADGNLYFTDCGASAGGLDGIGQVVPASQIRIHAEIPVPTQHSCPQGIVARADGTLWLLESNPSAGIYNVARLTPAKPFEQSIITEFPMRVAPGKLAFLTVTGGGTLWTANNGPDPGSILHVTALPPPGSRRRPSLSTIAVAQQPIPIADGWNGTIWFGSPSEPVLIRYHP